eukprot:6477061-Amphidinium_carterae.1
MSTRTSRQSGHAKSAKSKLYRRRAAAAHVQKSKWTNRDGRILRGPPSLQALARTRLQNRP